MAGVVGGLFVRRTLSGLPFYFDLKIQMKFMHLTHLTNKKPFSRPGLAFQQLSASSHTQLLALVPTDRIILRSNTTEAVRMSAEIVSFGIGDNTLALASIFNKEDSDESDIDSIAESIAGKEETDDPLVVFDLEDGIPSKIPDIIKLMDVLQPGQNFYGRRENLPKKVRVKLRAFARKEENLDNPAVRHWVDTKDWEPPNTSALSNLMVLIRDMINKAWPNE